MISFKIIHSFYTLRTSPPTGIQCWDTNKFVFVICSYRHVDTSTICVTSPSDYQYIGWLTCLESTFRWQCSQASNTIQVYVLTFVRVTQLDFINHRVGRISVMFQCLWKWKTDIFDRKSELLQHCLRYCKRKQDIFPNFVSECFAPKTNQCNHSVYTTYNREVNLKRSQVAKLSLDISMETYTANNYFWVA